jgi:hypothetical protein
MSSLLALQTPFPGFPEDLVIVSHTFQSWLVSSSQYSDILGRFPPFPQTYLFLNTSAPYAIAAFWFLLTSPPKCPSSLDFLYYTGPGTVFSGYVPLAPCHFCMAGHLSACDGKFLPRFTTCLDSNFPGKVSFSPCQFCTVGHLSAGGSRLPP